MLDYDVDATNGTVNGEMTGSAPMFIVGYKVAYASANLMYYFNVEYMDLDTVTLENVTGSVLDYTAGMRWVFDGSGNMAISTGFRSYEADLGLRGGDDFSYKMEGVFFSVFIAW